MFIYKITNSKNGHFYVGKTKHPLLRRFREHCRFARKNDTVLSRAIRKHGFECFLIALIEEIESEDLLNDREKHWIAELKPEYNMTLGGDGGWIHDQTGNRWKCKDSSLMGIHFRDGRQKEFIDYTKISGGNNYQAEYEITTPWGVYHTWKEAAKAGTKLRKLGHTNVISNSSVLKNYCLSDDIIVGRRIHASFRGKRPSELGFKIRKLNEQV